MEKKSLEKKIEDWAIGLGFSLPDESSLPPNFFAALTATPNRRKLWEILVDSIQPKKKVEYVRKQLLVTQLKERKKNFGIRKTKISDKKLELWDRQNELEKKIAKEKKDCMELEQNIFSKCSDCVFEICKLEELEKQCNEWKEKAFALNLFNRRGKRIVEDFDKILVPNEDDENKNSFLEELHQFNLQEELKNLASKIDRERLCNGSFDPDHECELLIKLKAIRELKVTEDFLWNEALNQKKIVFEQFLNGLNSLKDLGKNIREKEEAIKADLISSVLKLKKEILEKSMQVMINETQRRLLDYELEKLMENMEMLILKGSFDKNLSRSLSYVTQEEIDKSFSFKQKSLAQVKRYVNEMGKKSYYETLKKELSKVEVKFAKAKEECSQKNNNEKKLEETCKSIESITTEIENLRSQCDDQEQSIVQLNEKRLQMASSPERMELKGTIEKLKGSFLRQVELLLEIPLDALKNTKSHSEISSNFLIDSCNDHGEKLNNFFWPVLKLPDESYESVLKEVENDKKIKEKIQKFIAEREKLSDLQQKIFSRLSAITYDAKFCEKNSKEADGILTAIQSRASNLTTSIGFMEEVLKNWLEQPYRHMISDSEKVNGKTLKEYEQLYMNKKKNETHL